MTWPSFRRHRRISVPSETRRERTRLRRFFDRLLGRRAGERFWTWGRITRLLGFGIACVAVVVILVVAWASQSLPNPNNLEFRRVAQSTKIYARDGSTLLYEIHGDQKRTIVELKDISPDVIHAVIAIEDKDYYKHSGFSVRGLIRSVWVDIVRGTRAQGGSTLTQQLVKNAILTKEKSFIRKLKEIILSYQLERRYDKDQILKLYFNEIPWGSTAYGVEAAAHTYFGVSAKDLTLAESATLAAMVQIPSYYSPRGSHTDQLIERQHRVLSNMVEQGYITQEAADAAMQEDVLKKVPAFQDKIVAPHFVFYIRDILVQKYGELTVEQGGLSVKTTLDAKLQKIAEEEVSAGAKKNDKRGADNAALVSVDPKTGQILAMVGSRDFFDKAHNGQFNAATGIRNPGSSFKPIVYLTAFTRGYTPDTVLFDLKTNFGPDGSGKDFIPNNYDFREHGPLKMRQTLAGSLNIPAVKTLYLAGIPNVLNLAEKLGYSTIDRSKVGLALAIGGGGVRLVEHVGAFAALANDGLQNPVTGILEVKDKNGKTLEEFKKNETRAVDQNAVRMLQSVMSDNAARAYVFGSHNALTLPDRPVAAKTGTTNDWKDGWTMGFTPSLATGVWVGNNDNTAMNRGMDGVVVAAPIWQNFMIRATKGTKVEKFKSYVAPKSTKPALSGAVANETVVAVDTESGKRIPDACVASWPAAFKKEVTIKEAHTILFYVDREDPTGDAPKNPASDPMFSRWEGPIQQWAKKNGYLSKMPADDSCDRRVSTTTPTVTIASPLNNATVSGSTLSTEVSLANFGDSVTVTYTLDDQVLGSTTTAPYSASFDLGGVTNGFHTLLVSAVDAVGATASASVSINTLAQQETTVYFLQPRAGEKISAGSFPVAVKAYAFDPKGISTVSLYNNATDGTQVLLDRVTAPPDTQVVFSWATSTPGAYRLYLVVKTTAGKSVESDRLPVTVQ